MSVFTVIGSIARIVAQIAPVILAALKSLRPLVEEIDDVFSQAETLIDKEEEFLDDFIDSNAAQFEKLKEIGSEVREVGSGIYALADFLLISAEDEEVTLAEQRIALVRLYDLGQKIAAIADIELPEFVEPG